MNKLNSAGNSGDGSLNHTDAAADLMEGIRENLFYSDRDSSDHFDAFEEKFHIHDFWTDLIATAQTLFEKIENEDDSEVVQQANTLVQKLHEKSKEIREAFAEDDEAPRLWGQYERALDDTIPFLFDSIFDEQQCQQIVACMEKIYETMEFSEEDKEVFECFCEILLDDDILDNMCTIGIDDKEDDNDPYDFKVDPADDWRTNTQTPLIERIKNTLFFWRR